LSKISEHSHNINHPKTVKNDSDKPTLQQVFQVHKQKHGVCVCSQLIHNVLLDYSPSLKQMLLQL